MGRGGYTCFNNQSEDLCWLCMHMDIEMPLNYRVKFLK